jgi:uncharacterized protein YdeI (YjbR/CyaY-like superfamily)
VIASDGSSIRLRPRITTIAKASTADHREIRAKSRAAWRSWLEAHHAGASGVWLVFAKKHTGFPTVSYNEAVEEALCFGWIDSIMHPVDDRFYKQLFTPRKSKSAWSQSNKDRVERLRAAGLMTAAGEAAVAGAKESGAWDKLSAVEALEIPPDLQKALSESRTAKKNWQAFTPSQRKQFLYWLRDAKREPTRVERIAQIIELVSLGITPVKAYEEKRLRRSTSPARASSRDRRPRK